MKILYTVHQFLPEYFAGTEILTYDTAREMRRRGHDVYIFTGAVSKKDDIQDFFDSYVYDGFPISRYTYSRKARHFKKNPLRVDFDNPLVAKFFKTQLNEIKPDVVHFYHLHRLSASIIEICHQLQIPTVFSVTDFWVVCPTLQLFMPDYTLCKGPSKDSVNCFKHLLAVSKLKKPARIINKLPDRVLSVLLKWVTKFASVEFKPLSLIHALSHRQLYIRKQINRVNKVIVATKAMGNTLSNFGVDGKKIYHLPYAVNNRYIKKPPEKGTLPELHVGFIGTLFDHKGVHILIEAVKRLPKHLPIKILIYGDTEQFPRYTQRLAALAGDDERFHFKGTFNPDQIGNVFSGLDILVVPSLWHENTPLVIHSAQKAKVPVIASDVSGTREIISDGVNGFLFERGNPLHLSSIIDRLFVDRALVQRLSEASIPANTLSKYTDQLEGLYNEIQQ